MADGGKSKPRVYVSVTAVWGNGDAESEIKISRQRWRKIQQGEAYIRSGWGYYECSRSPVTWSFVNGLVSIEDNDGMECIVEESLDSLYVGVIDY